MSAFLVFRRFRNTMAAALYNALDAAARTMAEGPTPPPPTHETARAPGDCGAPDRVCVAEEILDDARRLVIEKIGEDPATSPTSLRDGIDLLSARSAPHAPTSPAPTSPAPRGVWLPDPGLIRILYGAGRAGFSCSDPNTIAALDRFVSQGYATLEERAGGSSYVVTPRGTEAARALWPEDLERVATVPTAPPIDLTHHCVIIPHATPSPGPLEIDLHTAILAVLQRVTHRDHVDIRDPLDVTTVRRADPTGAERYATVIRWYLTGDRPLDEMGLDEPAPLDVAALPRYDDAVKYEPGNDRRA